MKKNILYAFIITTIFYLFFNTNLYAISDTILLERGSVRIMLLGLFHEVEGPGAEHNQVQLRAFTNSLFDNDRPAIVYYEAPQTRQRYLGFTLDPAFSSLDRLKESFSDQAHMGKIFRPLDPRTFQLGDVFSNRLDECLVYLKQAIQLEQAGEREQAIELIGALKAGLKQESKRVPGQIEEYLAFYRTKIDAEFSWEFAGSPVLIDEEITARRMALDGALKKVAELLATTRKTKLMDVLGTYLDDRQWKFGRMLEKLSQVKRVTQDELDYKVYDLYALSNIIRDMSQGASRIILVSGASHTSELSNLLRRFYGFSLVRESLSLRMEGGLIGHKRFDSAMTRIFFQRTIQDEEEEILLDLSLRSSEILQEWPPRLFSRLD